MPEPSRFPCDLGLALALVVMTAVAARAETAPPIKAGQPFPELPEDSFAPLAGHPPTPAETRGRTLALVTFQAGQGNELDEAVGLLDRLARLGSADELVTLGVATCLDPQRDVRSLDDAFILAHLTSTSVSPTPRLVRDRDERFWPRVRVHGGGGLRRGTPALIVVAPSGRVIYTGFILGARRQRLAEDAVRAALASASGTALATGHPLVAPAAELYARDALGQAYRETTRLIAQESTPPAARVEAAELLFLINLRWETELDRIEQMVAEGRLAEVDVLLRDLRRAFEGAEQADEAKERREALAADPSLDTERKADRAVTSVLDDLGTRDLGDLATRRLFSERLRKTAARYPETASAARALRRADELSP